MDELIEKYSEIRKEVLEDGVNRTLISVTPKELTIILTALKIYRNIDRALDEEIEIKLQIRRKRGRVMVNIENLKKLKQDAEKCIKYGCENCKIDCFKNYGNIPPEDIWEGLIKAKIIEK